MSPELIALIVGVVLAVIVGFAMRTQRRKRRQAQAAAQQAWLNKRQTQTAKYLKPGLSLTSRLPRAIHSVDPPTPTATSGSVGGNYSDPAPTTDYSDGGSSVEGSYGYDSFDDSSYGYDD